MPLSKIIVQPWTFLVPFLDLPICGVVLVKECALERKGLALKIKKFKASQNN